jgi:hypothetical protein
MEAARRGQKSAHRSFFYEHRRHNCSKYSSGRSIILAWINRIRLQGRPRARAPRATSCADRRREVRKPPTPQLLVPPPLSIRQTSEYQEARRGRFHYRIFRHHQSTDEDRRLNRLVGRLGCARWRLPSCWTFRGLDSAESQLAGRWRKSTEKQFLTSLS